MLLLVLYLELECVIVLHLALNLILSFIVFAAALDALTNLYSQLFYHERVMHTAHLLEAFPHRLLWLWGCM